MITATIIGVLIGYLIVLIGIGVWAGKESHEVTGYYLAGKKLPAWVLAFSSNATGESAWLLLGLTGLGYALGVHAFWVILGEVLGVALAWVYVARPFKAYTDRYNSITIPDYLTDRFRDTTHAFRVVSAVIILSMVTAYVSAQLTASGKAFDAFLGTGYTAGVWIGLVIVLFYTTIGGFKAVAYSDFFQGVLMLLVLVTLPFVAFSVAGGWDEVIEGLRAENPALLLPMGEFGATLPGFISAFGFVAIGFAFLGSPQLLTRFMAARDQRQIVNGGVWAVVIIICLDTGAVLAGMAGRILYPGLADPEMILPELSHGLFMPFFTGIVLVVVLAAIMSTVDSLLILASSVVTRDVVQNIYKPKWSDRKFSILGKVVTVVLGLAAMAFALTDTRLIFYFVLFAWAGIASAFTPVILCSLFWKRTTRMGALSGMVAGFATAMIWALFLKEHFYDLYETIPGFIAGFIVTIGVSLLTEPPEGAGEELDDIHRQLSPTAPAAAALDKAVE